MPSPSLSISRGSPGSASKIAFASAQVAKAIQLHSVTHSVKSVGGVGTGSSPDGGGGSSVDDGVVAVGAKVGSGDTSSGVCSNASVGVASRAPARVDVASGATAVAVGVCSPAGSSPSPAHPLATMTPTTNIEYASASNRMRNPFAMPIPRLCAGAGRVSTGYTADHLGHEPSGEMAVCPGVH